MELVPLTPSLSGPNKRPRTQPQQDIIHDNFLSDAHTQHPSENNQGETPSNLSQPAPRADYLDAFFNRSVPTHRMDTQESRPINIAEILRRSKAFANARIIQFKAHARTIRSRSLQLAKLRQHLANKTFPANLNFKVNPGAALPKNMTKLNEIRQFEQMIFRTGKESLLQRYITAFEDDLEELSKETFLPEDLQKKILQDLSIESPSQEVLSAIQPVLEEYATALQAASETLKANFAASDARKAAKEAKKIAKRNQANNTAPTPTANNAANPAPSANTHPTATTTGNSAPPANNPPAPSNNQPKRASRAFQDTTAKDFDKTLRATIAEVIAQVLPPLLQKNGTARPQADRTAHKSKPAQRSTPPPAVNKGPSAKLSYKQALERGQANAPSSTRDQRPPPSRNNRETRTRTPAPYNEGQWQHVTHQRRRPRDQEHHSSPARPPRKQPPVNTDRTYTTQPPRRGPSRDQGNPSRR